MVQGQVRCCAGAEDDAVAAVIVIITNTITTCITTTTTAAAATTTAAATTATAVNVTVILRYTLIVISKCDALPRALRPLAIIVDDLVRKIEKNKYFFSSKLLLK